MMRELILAVVMMTPSVVPTVIEQSGPSHKKPTHVEVMGADTFSKNCKFYLNDKEVDFNIITEMPAELTVILEIKIEKRQVVHVKARYSTRRERDGS